MMPILPLIASEQKVPPPFGKREREVKHKQNKNKPGFVAQLFQN